MNERENEAPELISPARCLACTLGNHEDCCGKIWREGAPTDQKCECPEGGHPPPPRTCPACRLKQHENCSANAVRNPRDKEIVCDCCGRQS